MQLIDLLDAAEKKLEVAPIYRRFGGSVALRCAQANKQTNAARSARALRRGAPLRRRAGADGPRMLPPESPNSEPYALKTLRSFSTLKP